MRIICVNTGTKFESWYVDNLKHMIDKFSNLKYDKFEVITDTIYGGVYDKLQMFDLFKDGQNLYFDFRPLEFLCFIFRTSSKSPRLPKLKDTKIRTQT